MVKNTCSRNDIYLIYRLTTELYHQDSNEIYPLAQVAQD
jgi:hypothetical protein